MGSTRLDDQFDNCNTALATDARGHGERPDDQFAATVAQSAGFGNPELIGTHDVFCSKCGANAFSGQAVADPQGIAFEAEIEKNAAGCSKEAPDRYKGRYKEISRNEKSRSGSQCRISGSACATR